jgi:DNA repair ATPase RecN
MGEIMKEMSQTMQIFCHYPFTANCKKGNAHFKVSKSIGDNQLKLLTDEERH